MAATSLSRTPSSTGNRKTFTLSVWCKKMSSSQMNLLGAGASNAQNHIQFENNRFQMRYFTSSNATIVNTDALLRDESAWYHLVCAVDTTQATASNRIKLYINGEQQSLNDETFPGQNGDWDYNVSGETMYIGRRGHSAAYYYDGEMAHFAWVDGQQLTPSTFGETDSTSGIWKWKDITGVTWGTNGFYLKFENSANLGLDSSGQGNNFTLSGSGTKNIDNPSINYATWNALYGFKTYTSTYANGNTTVTTGSTQTEGNPATLGASSGKYYWEVKPSASSQSSQMWYGIGAMAEQTTDNAHELGHNANSIGYYGHDGTVRKGDTNVATLSTYTTNDIIGVALDLDNNLIYFYKNGTVQNSGTGISIPSASSTPFGFWFPAVGDWDNNDTFTFDGNFGNGYFGTTAISSAGSNGNGSLFEYDVPSGYYALNTKNINTYG